MSQQELAAKSKQLLARRTMPNNVWYYAKRNVGHQFLYFAGYIALAIMLWLLGQTLLSAAFAGFFIGTKVRDVRWWRVLSNEWPSTAELLDWKTIEALARRDPDGR